MKTGMPVVAIFDIGKTNKKFLLFDREYHVVYETGTILEPSHDDDGEACENLPALSAWMKQTLDDTLFDKRFYIKALNFSSYGASFVHLDKRGLPATPLYSYLKSYPEDLLQTFYGTLGDKETLALETASPSLGMLNSGLQLYWLKHKKPALFKRIKQSLHLPQYCSYLLTNKAHSEMTSIGCHTTLWDFRKKEYHSWVKQENLHGLFPAISPTDTKMDLPLGKHRFCAGIGIHDSSAALLPYLSSIPEPFLLLSTGTWSVTFNPFNDEPLTIAELSKDCLAYMSPEGKPVKASRLFLGNEHTYYEKKIATYFGKDARYHKTVKFDKQLVQKLLLENNVRKKFFPQTMEVSGYVAFKKSKMMDFSLFKSYEEAYHQLNIDLVVMQAMAIETVMGNTPIRKMYISGGFSDNALFVQLLASRFPEINVFTASMNEASALGAALLMHNCWNSTQPARDLFTLKQYPAMKDVAILHYVF
jgi:sugar (pentulose or hexulose) kinase